VESEYRSEVEISERRLATGDPQAEDAVHSDDQEHPLSNAFDHSEVFAASIPTLAEVDDSNGNVGDVEFDGTGEGIEEDCSGDGESPITNADAEYLDGDISPKPSASFRSWIPKYVLDRFNGIKEKYFFRPTGSNSISLYTMHHTIWVPQSNAAMLPLHHLTPETIYNPRFCVWDPMSIHLGIPCPVCKGRLTRHGAHHVPRRVIDSYDCYWIAGWRYLCSGCKDHKRQPYTFLSWDQRILSSLPKWVSMLFPAKLTHRSGMDIRLFKHMKLCFHSGMGAKQFSDSLRVAHKEHFHELHLQYILLIEKGLVFHRQSRRVFPNFGTFESEYAGFVPSARWLRDLYDADLINETPILDQHMAMIPVRIGSTDHSHKVCY
jgi:hypothetical protein